MKQITEDRNLENSDGVKNLIRNSINAAMTDVRKWEEDSKWYAHRLIGTGLVNKLLYRNPLVTRLGKTLTKAIGTSKYTSELVYRMTAADLPAVNWEYNGASLQLPGSKTGLLYLSLENSDARRLINLAQKHKEIISIADPVAAKKYEREATTLGPRTMVLDLILEGSSIWGRADMDYSLGAIVHVEGSLKGLPDGAVNGVRKMVRSITPHLYGDNSFSSEHTPQSVRNWCDQQTKEIVRDYHQRVKEQDAKLGIVVK